MQLLLKLFLLLTAFGLRHAELHLVSQPAYIKWAELVEHVPTAVSHQSSTIVHNSVPQRTALLAPAALRSFIYSLPPTAFNPSAAYVHAHATAQAQAQARAHLDAWNYRYTAPSNTVIYGK